MLLGVKLIHERQVNERICDARLQPEAEDKKTRARRGVSQ